VVRNSQAIEKSYLEADPAAILRAAAWIQHDVAQRLFTLAGLGDLDEAIVHAGKPGFHAVELPVRLKGHVESRVRRYVSANVLGRVAGADSGGNAVLYTAHYDHLGMDPDAKGDNIYNGAAVDLGGADRIDFYPTVERMAKAFDLQLLPDPNPMAGTIIAAIIFRWRAWGFLRSASTRASCSRGTTKPGGTRSQRTTPRTIITSRRMSIAPTGISAGMQSWRGSGLCWDGWPESSRIRSSGRPGTSSRRHGRRLKAERTNPRRG
jgi:hypothetical protein